MTEIARELLEDVQQGDYIRIRYGTNTDQIMIEGIIVKWSDHFLSLKKKDGGITKIRLDDNLRSLDLLENEDEASYDIKPKKIVSDLSKLDIKTATKPIAHTVEYRVLRQMVVLEPAQPYIFVVADSIDVIKEMVKVSSNGELKRIMGGILDSLSAAVKNNEVCYKYHDLRARIIQIWDKCEEELDFDIFYCSLGILAIIAEDYEYSLEPLVRAHKFVLATYAATMGKLSESAQVFSLCALLSGENSDINQYISEMCVAHRDVDTLDEILEKSKNDTQLCEKIASCAFMLFSASGGKLNSDITPYYTAYETAKKLLEAIPNEWKNKKSTLMYWKEFSKCLYPMRANPNKVGEEEIVGYIFKYNNSEKWGFITPNHYFYIEQVYDNTEKGIFLRKILSLGLWNNLEVVFKLGESPVKPGQSAATAIELTENGYKDALRRISDIEETGGIQKGFVEVFNPELMTGRIQAAGEKYNFDVNSIVDPWLKAYYEKSFSPREQDVTFETFGKKVINICWNNPTKDDYELYASSVSSDAVDKWNLFIDKRSQERMEIKLPDEDPYAYYHYCSLPGIESRGTNTDDIPLTWGGKTIIGIDIAKSCTNNTSYDPLKKKLPRDGRYYAERARKAMIEGHLKAAEQDFENALRIGGFNEAVVCDYISLNMRQEGKIDRAIDLIKKYERQISSEKLLNLKIQVFDKKKDYNALCLLYEEAYRISSSVSKKSHNLFRLIDAYIKLGKYNEALGSCKRWETFFNQNKFSSDADKLRKTATNINRQKAISYYHLGQVDEAIRIATDLVRANPTDTAANSILDGTLGKENASISIEVSDQDVSEVGEPEDSPEEPGSLITRFVRSLLQQTDIAVNLKSPNIKDGRYIGTSKEGLEDVKKLASRSRLSSKMRSDTLLSACKLLEQIEQRDDGTTTNEYYKYRLAGRAMASWGDFMVSQAGQLDTTRMAYLYALKILIPTKNGAEQDWINAYNRYLKSYFMARVGSNSLDEYIAQQTNSAAKDGANTDILVGNRIQDVLFSEFLVGILMMIKAIGNQTERMVAFVDDLYSKNTELRDSICQQLELYYNMTVSSNISSELFKSYLSQATEIMIQKKRSLNNIMVDISRIILSKPLTQEMLTKLDAENWNHFLTATDTARLNRINYIVRRSQDYFNSGDFENRADCIRSILLEINDLLQSISKEPTDDSYDVYLPVLEQIALKVTDKQTELYQEFLPKLSWRETIQPFRTPDGQVQIQLTIENEINYQSADSLAIVSVQGSDVAWFNVDTVQTIRGGDEVEIGLLVSLDDNATSSGSFSATIGYTYKCSDAPQNIITKNQEVEFTFIIRDENFEALTNPFSAYEGKLMDDDTMFVGRSTQIQQILDMVCSSESGVMNYGRAIAMYGQTRTGKSSLMYHLKRKLEERYQDDILIWDIGNIGELPETSEYMGNFLYNLLYIGSEAIYDNAYIADIVEKEGLFPPLEEMRQNSVFAVTLFNTYMKKLNAILQREKKIIVLLVDEFTYLHGYMKEGKISTDFMRFWKALLQNYCIFAIVAGQDDMPEFMREYQNEFACMELLKLTYLKERDAKLLVQKPLEDVNHRNGLFRNDGSIHKIYDLTAGSAYLTIILCSKLVSYLNEKGAYMVTKGIVNEFLRTRAFGPNGFLTEVHFEAQLQERGHRELDDINRNILLIIARLSQTTGYANINEIECDNLSRDDIQKYVNRLVDRNVLVKEGRDQYWIQVKLLERWLISTMGV